MLLKIREYIKTQQVVSIQQLTREFQIDEHALEPMLKLWEKKGFIKACKGSCKNSCSRQCGPKKPSFYMSC